MARGVASNMAVRVEMIVATSAVEGRRVTHDGSVACGAAMRVAVRAVVSLAMRLAVSGAIQHIWRNDTQM